MDTRIFKYFDGESDVFADPGELDFQIDRLKIQDMLNPDRVEMMPRKEDNAIDFEKLDESDMRLLTDMAHDAEPLIRQAFQVKPFDRKTGTGMLYEDVLKLYGSYIDWRDGVKKNTDQPPSSVPPTA